MALHLRQLRICPQCLNWIITNDICPCVEHKNCMYCGHEVLYFDLPQEELEFLFYEVDCSYDKYTKVEQDAFVRKYVEQYGLIDEEKVKKQEQQEEAQHERNVAGRAAVKAETAKANKCPRCGNDSWTPVRKKWTLFGGFATNDIELVCNHCGYRRKPAPQDPWHYR